MEKEKKTKKQVEAILFAFKAASLPFAKCFLTLDVLAKKCFITKKEDEKNEKTI